MKYSVLLLLLILSNKYCSAQVYNCEMSTMEDYNTGKKYIENTPREYVSWDKAIKYFNNAIEKDTCFAGAYYLRGECYDALGKLDEALEDLNNAIKFGQSDTNCYKYYYKRASIYYSLDNKKRAVEDYSRSIECNSNFIDAYKERGMTYNALGIQDSALLDIRTALLIDSTDATAIKCLKYYDKKEQAKVVKQFIKLEDYINKKGPGLRCSIWYLVELDKIAEYLLPKPPITQKRVDRLYKKLRKCVDADINKMIVFSATLEYNRSLSLGVLRDIYGGDILIPELSYYRAASTIEEAIDLIMRDVVLSCKISEENSKHPDVVDKNGYYYIVRNCIVKLCGKIFWTALKEKCIPPGKEPK